VYQVIRGDGIIVRLVVLFSVRTRDVNAPLDVSPLTKEEVSPCKMKCHPGMRKGCCQSGTTVGWVLGYDKTVVNDD